MIKPNVLNRSSSLLKKPICVVALLLFLVSVPNGIAEGTLTVRTVIDGDSLILSDGRIVRLIGVDTPEFKDQARNRKNASRLGVDLKFYNTFTQKASQFVREQVASKNIRLEFDNNNVDLGHKDKYGRWLAYVFLEEGEGEILLNALIIKEGYGFAMGFFPYERKPEFFNLQKEAKQNQRGFWSGP